MIYFTKCFVLLFCLLIVVSVGENNKQRKRRKKVKNQEYDKDLGDKNEVKSIYPRSNLISKRMHISFIDFYNEIEKRHNEHNNVLDLSWGFPDYMPPNHTLDALVEVAKNRSLRYSYLFHQYDRTNGNERLVKVVAKFYSMLMKREINWDTEVIVTTGASHALSMICQAYVNPGDEVIIFEPFYPFYYSVIRLAGGHPVYVQLQPAKGENAKHAKYWTFDRQELESKFNSKTKLIFINNPNNPTGKTFTKEELIFIGDLAEKHNVLILCDEVAQWYYFDDQPHIRMATLKNYWKRTLTVTSGGKTFSNTGWRIGWVIAPEELIWGLSAMTESSVFCATGPLQIAFAIGLETELQRWNTPESYFMTIKTLAISGKKRLINILEAFGAEILLPNAGYFLVANVTTWVKQMDLSKENDPRPGMKLNIALRKQLGITTMPLTIFHGPDKTWDYENILRFPIIKTNRAFNDLRNRLKKNFKQIGGKVLKESAPEGEGEDGGEDVEGGGDGSGDNNSDN